ncbi:sterol desaturase family protein [Burkholderia anthina]|uniref:sterol desaturase family protein n=1 Tax=Burkholderia anthina TaxID=179879 RepID=UPI001AA084A9|nr:sterol desaturase family protein [Burkholderia anthina]QTD90837.1 sterol desaturase family protein [Burkholderia anthina]
MWLRDWASGFFGLNGIASLFGDGRFDWHVLLTLHGFESIISPLFPLLLVAEILFLCFVYRSSARHLYAAYKAPVMMYVVNVAIAALVNLNVFVWTQQHFAAVAPFTATLRIRWFIYAYVVWELSHFVYHWTCHKVRLLWILHSPHHAPHHMNLSVIFTAFFLQGTYATFVRTAICSFLGVPIELLILCMVIDGCWGALIHFSEELWPSGRFGFFLDRWMLTPSDHRVHHASNTEYLDMNYCNTLPIWDKIFGTLQREIPGIKPKYGLVRQQKENSFSDMYFGEIGLLWRDIKNADSFSDRVLHIVMPPGWKPSKDR